MQEVTEIEHIDYNGKLSITWGNEARIFGELEIALDDFTNWIDEHSPVIEQVPENYTGSDWYYVPSCDEVSVSGSQLFESGEYVYKYGYRTWQPNPLAAHIPEKVREYLIYHKFIA